MINSILSLQTIYHIRVRLLVGSHSEKKNNNKAYDIILDVDFIFAQPLKIKIEYDAPFTFIVLEAGLLFPVQLLTLVSAMLYSQLYMPFFLAGTLLYRQIVAKSPRRILCAR